MTAVASLLLAVSMFLLSPVAPSTTNAEPGVDVPYSLSQERRPVAMEHGQSGAWIAVLNESLAEAGFHPDDGYVFGDRTRHAVFAFQKMHELDTTGVFTEDMWPLLDQAPRLLWRPEADRVEVDLARQVLYVVEDRRITYVIPISSGDGGTFVNASGNVVRARTPEGRFEFERVISGLRVSYLGALYNPFYFRGGYAIHGSPEVPNEPASHGCVRVTNWDMDLLKHHFEIGEAVYISSTSPQQASPFLPVAD
jgi:peptidoglycan hydrolase-like protein with peptidoglycan-binding domain